MKLCGTFSGDGPFWKVQLDVRDLGRHLDFTNGARAGTLSCRVKEATAGVAALDALPLGFQVKLGWVRGKKIRAGLHAAEASCVSSSSLSAFRDAIVWAVWSSKMPLADTPAVLNLLDGPVCVDPALHIVCVRFRMMRWHLAYCPDEKPRIFRMLDFDFWGGPWSWPCASPLRMMAGPIQHFFSSILDAWRYSVLVKLSERECFRVAQFARILKDLCNYSSLPS